MGPRDISDIVWAKVGGGCFRLAPPLSPDPIERPPDHRPSVVLTTERLLHSGFSVVPREVPHSERQQSPEHRIRGPRGENMKSGLGPGSTTGTLAGHNF